MEDDNRGLTLLPSAASNPGRLKVNYLRWFLHKPTWPLIWAGSALIFILGALYLHWSLWIPAALLLVWNILYWVRVREHFWNGCANPGVVVSVDPLLIAVLTDLTQGVGSYPALKLIAARIRHIEKGPPRIGDRVATVALYTATFDEKIPHWVDFDPYPAQYATGDSTRISALMETFTTEDWAELDEYLKQVPQPYKVGLYMIKSESKSK